MAPGAPESLWRYVKPSWLDATGCLLPICFDLRSEKDPPEDYVSFHEGIGASESERLASVVSVMTNKGFTLKRTGRMLSIQVDDVCQVINEPNPVIRFVDKGRPHYGMCYLTEDDSLVLEAKNLLALTAELHDCHGMLSA